MEKKNEASNALDTTQKVIGILGGLGAAALTALQIMSHINGKK